MVLECALKLLWFLNGTCKLESGVKGPCPKVQTLDCGRSVVFLWLKTCSVFEICTFANGIGSTVVMMGFIS